MNKTNIETLWQDFAVKYALTEVQLNQFKKYAQLLEQWNNVINLTRIIDIEEIIAYHFDDSLSISKFIDFNNIKSVSDIGTGGGFPGIPIKIKYPHLNVVLIEVIAKKRDFLGTVVQELSLNDVELYPFDWRTFLRTTSYNIDLFMSRASLHTDELVRVFKGGTVYNNAQLVYWASSSWEPTNKEIHYLKKEETYEVGNKKRKLIFFSK